MKEKRESERRPYSNPVTCSVSVFDVRKIEHMVLKCTGSDISDRGIGLKADYPLEPGHVIRFGNDMNDKIGVVRWSTKHENRFRVGIRFV